MSADADDTRNVDPDKMTDDEKAEFVADTAEKIREYEGLDDLADWLDERASELTGEKGGE